MRINRSPIRLLFALLALVLLSPLGATKPAAAAPGPSSWSDAVELSVGAAPFESGGWAQDTSIAIDGAGNTLVTYRFTPTGQVRTQYVYNLRVDGVWQDPQQVMTPPTNSNAYMPVTTQLSNGDVMLIMMWENMSTYVITRLYTIWDSDSRSWSTPQELTQLVSAGTGSYQTHLTPTPDGALLVARKSDSPDRILTSRYRTDSGWEAVVDHSSVATSGIDNESETSLLTLADGSVAYTYNADSPSPVNPRAIVIHPDDTASLGVITDDTTEDYVKQRLARLIDPDGAVFIFNYGNPADVYAAYYDSATDTWSSNNPILPADPFTDFPYQVVNDADGNIYLLATYANDVPVLVTGNQPQTNGWTNPAVNLHNDAFDIDKAAVASTAGGSGVFAYSGKTGSMGEVYVIGVPATGGPTDPILISSKAGASGPVVAVGLDTAGRPSIVWVDNGVVTASNYYEAIAPLPAAEPEQPGGFVPETLCELPLALTIAPERLTLGAGTSGEITVTVTNPCGDVYAKNSDVLISLPAGMTVSNAPDWLLDLTQRIAWQNIVLMPAESRSFTFGVAADASAAGGPIVGEVYRGGRVVATTTAAHDVVAADAPALESAVEPAADAAAAPATPAPLPTVLPNTGGDLAPALGLTAAALAMLLVGSMLRRRITTR